MSPIASFLEKKVLVITTDSRCLVGVLKACDNSTNLALSGCVERVIREPDDPEGSMVMPLGMWLVRGETVCSIGLIDEKLDDSIDWTLVRGSAIGGTKHV